MKHKTHDYRKRYWGHDYVWHPENNGLAGSLSGWGHGIEQGDYIIFGGGDGARYKFTSVRYCLDPSDMWFGKVKFAPRSAAMKEREARKSKPVSLVEMPSGISVSTPKP